MGPGPGRAVGLTVAGGPLARARARAQTRAVVAAAIDAPVWLTFFATVAVGYVRAVPTVDDAVLVSLLPHLAEGLRARDAADYQVGVARRPAAARARPLTLCLCVRVCAGRPSRRPRTWSWRSSRLGASCTATRPPSSRWPSCGTRRSRTRRASARRWCAFS